ncbi:phage terminase small subunit P27 family [Sulfitobacter sp. PS-8MA]|uniref:phage terminase small subunit P27 family n=1 Tax=Sulfitobacter sp. PS-8MA TaxID=3237707 RepID=UPI0034C65AC5
MASGTGCGPEFLTLPVSRQKVKGLHMGRKPIPDKLKLVKGTARADRMNPDAPAANPGVATAPEWLSERAAEIFAQLSATLLNMGIASPDDQVALALLSSRIEEVELMTAAIEDGGRTYDQKDENGNIRMRRAAPEVGLRNEAMRHAQSLLAEFGLTPAARSKVSAGKPADENPFKALG